MTAPVLPLPGHGVTTWIGPGPLPNPDADLSPGPNFRRECLGGAQTFSLETQARITRFELAVPPDEDLWAATCDASTFDETTVGGSGANSCVGVACCWDGRDGFHRVSTVFVELPMVRGAAVGELLGFLLLCHRWIQLAPCSVRVPAGARPGCAGFDQTFSVGKTLVRGGSAHSRSRLSIFSYTRWQSTWRLASRQFSYTR